MSIQRNVILAIIGICLLAVSGCRAVLVAVPTGPSAHAPTRVYHANHRYHYYPQEQVYFDPVRRVYFYPDGQNWRMVSTPPRWIQLSQSDYVVIDMEHAEPYREFERHRTTYPRRGHDARKPMIVAPPPDRGHHAKHLYHYYPQEQVYFDPGRKVYFYQDGRNWRTASKMPRGMRSSQSDYVPIKIDHDAPYREFEKHRTIYPRRDHDKRQPREISHGSERDRQHWESDEQRNISHRGNQEERQPRMAPPEMERGNHDRGTLERSGYPHERQVEQQPRTSPPESERGNSGRDLWDKSRHPQERQVEQQPRVAPPGLERGNPNQDRDRNGYPQDRQVKRQPRVSPPGLERGNSNREARDRKKHPEERQIEQDNNVTASADPEKSDQEEEDEDLDPKNRNKRNNKKNKNKRY